MSKLSLMQQLQALLFVANEPLSLTSMSQLTDSQAQDVENALAELTKGLQATGLRLSRLNDHYELVTMPEANELIRRYLENQARTELSKPALETLAILAYRGPLTRAAVDEIRGVASEMMLRNLLQRGLISEQGKAKTPGRPALYGVSHSFLRHFGLASLEELPPLPTAAEETA
jgi:segregation and condensation protein B